MRLSLSYATFYGQRFEQAIEAARDRGFDGMQLIPDQTPNLLEELTPSRRIAIRRSAEMSNVSISLHNVFYDINLTSVVPAVSETALKITADVLVFARDVGAESVVVHPGYMFPGWRRDERQRELFWQRASDSLRSVCDHAESAGLRVLFENGSYCLTTLDRTPPVPLHLAIIPAEIQHLMALSEHRAGICLDVNKALRSGHPLSEFIETAGPALEQLQMSTVQGRWDEIHPFLLLLRERGFDGTIVLEGSAEETQNGYRVLRQFWA
jgi:sugar phosphate isomerase/epimerase